MSITPAIYLFSDAYLHLHKVISNLKRLLSIYHLASHKAERDIMKTVPCRLRIRIEGVLQSCNIVLIHCLEPCHLKCKCLCLLIKLVCKRKVYHMAYLMAYCHKKPVELILLHNYDALAESFLVH